MEKEKKKKRFSLKSRKRISSASSPSLLATNGPRNASTPEVVLVQTLPWLSQQQQVDEPMKKEKEPKKEAKKLPSIPIPKSVLVVATTKLEVPAPQVDAMANDMVQQYEARVQRLTQSMTPEAGEKKIRERPRSMQPTRARSSMQVTETVQKQIKHRGSLSDPVLASMVARRYQEQRQQQNNTNDYNIHDDARDELREKEEEEDPDIAEMQHFEERRAVYERGEKRTAYSCDDAKETRITITVNNTPWDESPMSTPPIEKNLDQAPSFLSYMVPSPRVPSPRALGIINALVVIPSGASLNTGAYSKFRNGILNERLEPHEQYRHCFVCERLCNEDGGELRSITAVTGRVVVQTIGAGGERQIFRQINICTQCQFQRDLNDPLIPLPPSSLALFKPLICC